MGPVLEEDLIIETTPDQRIKTLAEKVMTGERLSFDDGMAILDSKDIHGIGHLADIVKRRKCGNKVYFVVNCHINPTNLCALSCKFCAFYAKKGDANAYEMSAEDVFRKIDSVKDDIREVHIVGGHHPDWPFETYVDYVRMVKQRYPWVNVKAYTASEIDYFTRITRRPLEDILTELKEAGLDTMPGGGAEVFSDRLHKLLFPGKADRKRWLEVHRMAHKLGIRSNATILFGHIETPEEIVSHLMQLRDLEDEAPGFFAFIPLSFHPEHTEMSHIPQSSGLYDLKIVALSRLMLDNFPHIKSYWIQLGEKTAQAALHYGASDLDGTILEEVITHAAGATSPVGMTKNQMVRLISEAGYTPVERDALYNELKVYA